MSLAAYQNTPAIDTAFSRPDSTLYQLQPSFHTKSTEPEPTARARCDIDCAEGYANFDEAKGCANAGKGYCCQDTKPAKYPFTPNTK